MEKNPYGALAMSTRISANDALRCAFTEIKRIADMHSMDRTNNDLNSLRRTLSVLLSALDTWALAENLKGAEDAKH